MISVMRPDIDNMDELVAFDVFISSLRADFVD